MLPARARRLAALIVIAFACMTSMPAGVLAAECALTGPHAVHVGDALSIEGTGFPASSSVSITVAIAGGSADQFSVQSSTAGVIAVSLTPDSLDEGTMTVTAESGSNCSAQAELAVVAAGATLPPEPAPTEGAGVAGEGAAGEGAAGEGTAGEGAPRTDTGIPSAVTGTAWLFAGLLLVMGAFGLMFGRSPRRR